MERGNIDPFRLFGVSPDASFDEIRRRYHQLALAYHPDHRGGNDPQQAKRFTAVRAAYEAILETRQASERTRTYGPCRVCGALTTLAPRLDGRLVCRGCLLGPDGIRLLPAPAWVVLKCTFSAACLLAAVVCLVLHLVSGSLQYGLAACMFGLAGLVVVALLGLLFPVTPARQLRRLQERRSRRPRPRAPFMG